MCIIMFARQWQLYDDRDLCGDAAKESAVACSDDQLRSVVVRGLVFSVVDCKKPRKFGLEPGTDLKFQIHISSWKSPGDLKQLLTFILRSDPGNTQSNSSSAWLNVSSPHCSNPQSARGKSTISGLGLDALNRLLVKSTDIGSDWVWLVDNEVVGLVGGLGVDLKDAGRSPTLLFRPLGLWHVSLFELKAGPYEQSKPRFLHRSQVR